MEVLGYDGGVGLQGCPVCAVSQGRVPLKAVDLSTSLRNREGMYTMAEEHRI